MLYRRASERSGDGPERELVLAASDHNVHYAGIVDQARVAALLDEAAVVVIPSTWYEGYPRVVAEAFERGRPVAASAIGGLGELITPDVGWTAPPEPGPFAEMLSFAALDPERERKGAAARSVFESTLTPRVAMASLLDLYEMLASGRR